MTGFEKVFDLRMQPSREAGGNGGSSRKLGKMLNKETCDALSTLSTAARHTVLLPQLSSLQIS